MTQPRASRYRGLFPAVPTTLDERGGLDLGSRRHCVDFMLDAGSDGLCILADFFEQSCLARRARESPQVAYFKTRSRRCIR